MGHSIYLKYSIKEHKMKKGVMFHKIIYSSFDAYLGGHNQGAQEDLDEEKTLVLEGPMTRGRLKRIQEEPFSLLKQLLAEKLFFGNCLSLGLDCRSKGASIGNHRFQSSLNAWIQEEEKDDDAIKKDVNTFRLTLCEVLFLCTVMGSAKALLVHSKILLFNYAPKT
ncbi:hypothetical protein CR513_03558, partial [Mucuna pruriens]